MTLGGKLAILADAAKYDASCASSGGAPRNSVGGRGIGSVEGGAGICHSYAPDGRCISLLKILLTNFCQYDCKYCVNRVSSNVPRARFTVAEVVQLTLDFYRRNLIEGLFLSSGIIQSPDYTMEQVVAVARSLREQHDFRGYIHLKTIPEASPALLREAGRHADRLSINIELPTHEGLAALAPEKDGAAIQRSMATLRTQIEDAQAERREALAGRSVSAPGMDHGAATLDVDVDVGPDLRAADGVAPKTARSQPLVFVPGAGTRRALPPRFAASQSTQMIVGADDASDTAILATSARLYGSYHLKRVYYSAFSPIPDASPTLPLAAPPLLREHRLYQADWLMRFYGFEAQEIVPTAHGGMLSLQVDPKHAWALAHPERFPVDLNLAPRELLLRVPGLGVKAVDRLLAARRVRRIRAADLKRLHVPASKVLPFVVTVDHRPAAARALCAASARNLQGARTPQLQQALF